MVAVDEILGWIVAGLVTLGGVLAASYLTERAAKQRHHLNALKEKVFRPWSSWIASVRKVPALVAFDKTGYTAVGGYFPIGNVPECVRTTHYPELCKDWEALDLSYRQLVSQTMDFESSVESRVSTLVGGQRVRLNYSDPKEFPGYNPELVRLLVDGVISRIKNELWSFPTVTSEIPKALLGQVGEGKHPWWIMMGGGIMANWLAENDHDSITIERKFASSLREITENPELVKKGQIALSTESGFRVRIAEFESRLGKILSFDQSLPGICTSVEPRRFVRRFTLKKERL